MQKEKWHDCVQSITYGINRTAEWREKVISRYPADARNRKALAALRKLANDAPNLNEYYWAKLEPYYEWGSERFRSAVSDTAREVGFKHKSGSFPFFVNNLVATLSQPAAVN